MTTASTYPKTLVVIRDCHSRHNLVVTARTADGEVMAVRSAEGLVHGLQFHPESIMTPDGRTIMENFLRSAGVKTVVG